MPYILSYCSQIEKSAYHFSTNESISKTTPDPGHSKRQSIKHSNQLLTDVIQRPSAEFAVELLGSEPPEIINSVGPQVQNIVPGERLSFLQHHHLSPQQGQFDGRSQPTRPCTQHKTLRERRWELDASQRMRKSSQTKCFYALLWVKVLFFNLKPTLCLSQ